MTGPPAARRHDVVDHLFTQALGLSATQREVFVRSRADDDSVARSVLRMLADYDRLSSFLEGPAIPNAAPEIEPGMLLAGRFRVVEFLAGGGMGNVYTAEDLRLSGPGGAADRELVAIKLCRWEMSSLPWLIDRFRQEIRLGRRISHPRICRIHDVHEDVPPDGRPLVFFSMELLEGSPLSEWMQPPRAHEPGEILPILAAIAEGLDAAHRAEIVHRDLKPGNVIMTPAGPVITDFGLALAAVPEDAEPAAGEAVVGSVPYMAPEQFRGQSVTAAADVFSFGVLGYELIHGALPFPVQPIAAAVEARLSEAFERSPRWAAALDDCLRAEPKQRPPSAGEVVRRIEAASGRWSRRRVLPWLVGAGVASTLGAGLLRLAVSPVVPDGVRALALAAVGGRDEAESDAVGVILRSQLGQSAHVELLGQGAVSQALARMERPDARPEQDRILARQVALREGAALLIAPELVAGSPDKVRIEIEKLGSHPYLPLASWSEEFAYRSPDERITALTEAVEWIRSLTGEQASDLAARARRPEEVTTGNWEALLAYTRAENARAAGDDQQAIRLLSKAVELDPGFAAAHMRLGDILEGHGRWREAWESSSRAAALVSERGLTDRESYRILGMHYLDGGDLRRAEPVFQQWAADYPGDYLPLFYLGSCRERMGRAIEALDTFTLALERAPGNPHATLARAQVQMSQGRLEEARSGLDAVRGVNSWWWRYEAEWHFLQLDIPAALAAFDAFGELGMEEASTSFLLRACLFAECGAVEKAVAELQAGIAFDSPREPLRRMIPAKRIALGRLALARGDTEAAVAAASQAAERREDLRRLIEATMLLYRCGAGAQAERLWASLGEAPDSPKFQELAWQVEGCRALSARAWPDAIAAFRKSADLGWAATPAVGLAEALDASGDATAAEVLWSGMAQYPGRYWLEPERYGPALFRKAVARMAGKDADARRKLQALDEAGERLGAAPPARG